MKFTITSLLVIGSVTLGGATVQSQRVIDCANAPQQLAHLEHEKKSTIERIGKGVTSIMPVGLVLNLLKGTEKEHLEMATGEYNDRIDAHIAEIKKACDIR